MIQLDLERVRGAGRFVVKGTKKKKNSTVSPNPALLRKNTEPFAKEVLWTIRNSDESKNEQTNRTLNTGTEERQRIVETGIRRVREARRRYARHTRNL